MQLWHQLLLDQLHGCEKDNKTMRVSDFNPLLLTKRTSVSPGAPWTGWAVHTVAFMACMQQTVAGNLVASGLSQRSSQNTYNVATAVLMCAPGPLRSSRTMNDSAGSILLLSNAASRPWSDLRSCTPSLLPRTSTKRALHD